MQKMLGLMSLFTMLALAGCVDEAGKTEDPAADPKAEAPQAAATPAPVQTAAELARMQAFVATRVDRSAVKQTLRTKAGRRIDCVDINRQPALRGAPLEPPPQVLDAPALSATERATLAAVGPATLYTLGGGAAARCPAGTVPRPEVTMADLRRFATLDDYFAKDPSGARGASGPAMPSPSSLSPAMPAEESDVPHLGPTSKHQYAHARRTVANWGAETRMSIPSLATEIDKEFSLGQIWVSGGTGDGLQTLEVGIQRYHQHYGDDKQHLFIYSTRGNYQDGTGCYNNECDDFVQVSQTWIPGEEVDPVSVVGGAQYELYIHWTKAGDSGAWWLSVNGEQVGYYPRNLYDAVKNHAAKIDFGDEITDYQTDGRHTKTNMGTGKPAADGWQQAAFMRLIRYHDSNPSGNAVTWHEGTGLSESESDAACYSVELHTQNDPNWHYYLWYGGGGYANPACL